MIPDYYVWDGYEYVGVVGNQYCYLGPANVWVVAEPYRLERFLDGKEAILIGAGTPSAMIASERPQWAFSAKA